MLHFSATDLRPVLDEAQASHNRVFLIKDRGLYLMAEGGSRRETGRDPHLAFAAGCHPDKDEDWYDAAAGEAGGDDFCEDITLTPDVCRWVLDNHGDLQIALTQTQIVVRTALPASRFVPVAEYRNQTDRLLQQAGVHFCACRGTRELAAWRHAALRILDDVTGIDCKRTTERDRTRRAAAFTALKTRINTLTPEGVIRYPAR